MRQLETEKKCKRPANSTASGKQEAEGKKAEPQQRSNAAGSPGRGTSWWAAAQERQQASRLQGGNLASVGGRWAACLWKFGRCTVLGVGRRVTARAGEGKRTHIKHREELSRYLGFSFVFLAYFSSSLFLLFTVLSVKSRASRRPGKCSTSNLHSSINHILLKNI